MACEVTGAGESKTCSRNAGKFRAAGRESVWGKSGRNEAAELIRVQSF